MSYITLMQLLYLCEKAVQQMVTPASLCYLYFIYIQMNGFFFTIIFSSPALPRLGKSGNTNDFASQIIFVITNEACCELHRLISGGTWKSYSDLCPRPCNSACLSVKNVACPDLLVKHLDSRTEIILTVNIKQR